MPEEVVDGRGEFERSVRGCLAAGLALLLLDGPLADVPDHLVDPLIAATVDATVAGLCAPAPDGAASHDA